MSLTLTRRLAAIAVAVVIPFGATASAAHAAPWTPQTAQVVTVSDDDDSGVGFTAYGLSRSSWS